MVRRLLTVLCLGALCFLLANCGQTYQLQSITVTPGALGATGSSAIALDGIGSFQQLTVTASFSNTKTENVTAQSTYSVGGSMMDTDLGNPDCESSHTCVAPMSALTVDNSGIVKAVGMTCTWDAEPTNATDSAFGYATEPYPVTVTYTNNGITATTKAYVSVDDVAGCYDGIGFPAPTGFPGNSVAGWPIEPDE